MKRSHNKGDERGKEEVEEMFHTITKLMKETEK
jgi:hypothetical protein